jgi:hypothetical protein
VLHRPVESAVVSGRSQKDSGHWGADADAAFLLRLFRLGVFGVEAARKLAMADPLD